jgi:hypothetical protein
MSLRRATSLWNWPYNKMNDRIVISLNGRLCPVDENAAGPRWAGTPDFKYRDLPDEERKELVNDAGHRVGLRGQQVGRTETVASWQRLSPHRGARPCRTQIPEP